MKKFYLVALMLLCLSSTSAQHHRTKVPALAKYDRSVDIEGNLNMLLNEVISLDFSECESMTINSIKAKDTIWIRKVKNPSMAKEGRHYEIKYKKVSATDFHGKEFLVKRIDTKT